MRFDKRLLVTPLLATLFANHAQAHGLWTEQRRGNIEVIYGHGAEDDAFNAEKVSGAWAFDGQGRMVPVTVERQPDHARLKPLKAPATLAVALDNGPWSQTADKQWINQGEQQVPGAIASIHTWKYSLAFYKEGAQLPELKRVRLAIVPEVDPLQVGPGKPLPVRVLLDGRPAAGVELIGDYRGEPDAISAKTDAEGRAKVMVRNAALNIIAAQVTLETPDDPDVKQQGLFSSLTFLGAPHHE
ncbi:Nickel uptake substrate-specific transmembrane region [compost metagenome]